MKNTSDQLFHVSRHYKLGHLLDITYDNCFFIKNQSAYNSAAITPTLHSFENLSTGPSILPTDPLMKTIFNNWIKVYRDVNAVTQISKFIAEYLSIWEFQSFIQIPLER